MKKCSIILITGVIFIVLFLVGGFILVKKYDKPKTVIPYINTHRFTNKKIKLKEVCVVDMQGDFLVVLENKVIQNQQYYYISYVSFKDNVLANNKKLKIGDIVNITYEAGELEEIARTYANATKVEIIGVASQELLDIGLTHLKEFRGYE